MAMNPMKYQFRELAVQHGVEVLKLPTHTTHLLQPLDLSVFKPLKTAYDNAAHRPFISERRYVTKKDFPKLIGEAWKSYDPQIGVNGFKKAEIFPFNRDAISIKSTTPSDPFSHIDICNESESITQLLGNNIRDETENNINITYSPSSPLPSDSPLLLPFAAVSPTPPVSFSSRSPPGNITTPPLVSLPLPQTPPPLPPPVPSTSSLSPPGNITTSSLVSLPPPQTPPPLLLPLFHF